MKAKKRDNLGQTFYVATEKAPCRNIAGFAEHAVKTAHESRAVYNACIRILVEADDEDMPLRSGHGYKGLSLLATLLELRTRTPWLQDVSSNVRRSAAAQAHTAFGRWLEAQRLNAWKLARASDLRQKRRKTLEQVDQLRNTNPAKYRRIRKETLKSVRKMRRTARTLHAKVERYARQNRDPLRMMRKRKHAERRQRLTFPLIAGPVRFLDDTHTELRMEGFGDVTLKRPLPDGMEPVSLTLVARRKRRHRKQQRRLRLEQLEWSAHVQYRQHVEQKPVTPDAPSVGVDPGATHAATTQDDQGRITHYNYTGTPIAQHERGLQNLRRRRAECSRKSRRWRRYNQKIRRTSKRLTNLRHHQTVQMANAIVGENAIVGIEDFQADNARRSARGTHETPGTNVQAKRGLSRALDYSRPGELKQEVKRASERRGAVWNLHPAKNTSRRCAQCGHTAKKNRESQAAFQCRECGHTANADANAAENHRQGAVKWLLAKADRRKASRRGAASTVPRSQRKPAAKASPRDAGAPYKATGVPPTTTTRRKKRNRPPTQDMP